MVAWVARQGHRRKLAIIMSFFLQHITTALLRKGQSRFVKLNDVQCKDFVSSARKAFQKLRNSPVPDPLASIKG